MSFLKNLNWLDGGKSEGCFILEMHFANGGVSYWRNQSYEKVTANYDLWWRVNPELVALTIYDPKERVIANKCRMAQAV